MSVLGPKENALEIGWRIVNAEKVINFTFYM